MDLSVTNTWLAVGAISLAVIALAVVATLFFVARAAGNVSESVARASTAIENISQQVSPVAAQASAVLGDVHGLVRKFQATDAEASGTAERIAHGVRQIGSMTQPGLLSLAATGAAAIVQWFAGRKSRRPTAVKEGT